MGRISLGITFLVVCLVLVQPAQAVVVYKKGSNKPVAGHLVRQNDKEVVVRDEASSGLKEIAIPRSEIEDLIETVSAERLAILDSSRPQEYREYAEELAEKNSIPRPG